MLNIAEYRSRADRLADHLPWAALVADGVVLNKDGSFLSVLAFRGPDTESATPAELVALCARANNVLKRFGTGWALFFEAERREALGYPDSAFPDAASWAVDQERRAGFEAEGQHYESRFFLSLVWLPPADSTDAAGRSLVERPEGEGQQGRDWRGALLVFSAEVARALDLFSAFLPEIHLLSSGELLTYLHGTISTRQHPIAVPETPIYLDALLADTPLTGGLEPKLGDHHVRTLTLCGFPPSSRPAVFDGLNACAFPYRWVTRFIALDKAQATSTLTKLRRQWFNKRKSITALLREVMYNSPAQLLDNDADNKVQDADEALQALGGDHVAFGYLTTTIAVTDTSRARVEEKLRAFERIIGGLGFATIRESVNAVEAWLSSLPGQVYANVRQPLVHTLNLAHLMPLSSVWAGLARNAHLDGPPLLMAQTAGSTPFRLSTHIGDVGHMLVVGPTGAGKSVLLGLMALQFRRYAGAQVILFDKGNSARAAVLACGGVHHSLGLGSETDGNDVGSSLAFQPLRHIDRADTRAWAVEWLSALLSHEKMTVSPEVKDALWSALASLASAPEDERTLTGLVSLLQSRAAHGAQPLYARRPLWPPARCCRAAFCRCRYPVLRDRGSDGAGGRGGAGTELYLPSPRRTLRRATDLADVGRSLDIPRSPAVRRPHSRMAQDLAQEKCRGAVCDPELGRHCSEQHRARDTRELPAAAVPAQ